MIWQGRSLATLRRPGGLWVPQAPSWASRTLKIDLHALVTFTQAKALPKPARRSPNGSPAMRIDRPPRCRCRKDHPRPHRPGSVHALAPSTGPGRHQSPSRRPATPWHRPSGTSHLRIAIVRARGTSLCIEPARPSTPRQASGTGTAPKRLHDPLQTPRHGGGPGRPPRRPVTNKPTTSPRRTSAPPNPDRAPTADPSPPSREEDHVRPRLTPAQRAVGDFAPKLSNSPTTSCSVTSGNAPSCPSGTAA